MGREGWVKGGGLTGIGADRLNADAQHIALHCQEADAIRVEAGRMGAVGLGVEERFFALALGPVGAQQQPRACRDLAMFPFPRLDMFTGQQEIFIERHLFAHINDTSRANKLAHGDGVGGVVGAILARDPVSRCIKMGAGMLAQGDGVPIPSRPLVVIVGNLRDRQPRRRCKDRR